MTQASKNVSVKSTLSEIIALLVYADIVSARRLNKTKRPVMGNQPLKIYVYRAMTSITVAQDDKGYFVYYDSANRKVKRATNASGAWPKENVASPGGNACHGICQ